MKLLRFGAEVLVTSRKWNTLIDNYQKEPDFEVWKNHLHIAKINFNLAHIDELLPEFDNIISEIWGKDAHIDIVIHNAAQTIDKVNEINIEEVEEETKNRYVNDKRYPPVTWSKNPYPGIDKYSRVLDKRQINTWSTKFGNVNYSEAKQVLLINAWAPFVLNEFLLPKLMKSPNKPYIIHVHAKEGHFSSHKTLNHTHTNMAKAALSMLTRCLSGHYANLETNKYYQSLFVRNIPWLSPKKDKSYTQSDKPKKGRKKFVYKPQIEPLYPPKFNEISDKIRIHGVDPGWFSLDEYPLRVRQEKHLIFPPIDDIDAASRIVYPIIIDAPSFPGTWKHYIPLCEF